MSGKIHWRVSKVARFVAASKDRVYVADKTHRLHMLDIATGDLLGTLQTQNMSLPVINQSTDRIFLASPNGLIQCLHETGLAKPMMHSKKYTENDGSMTKEDAGSGTKNDSGSGTRNEDDMADDEAESEEEPFGEEVEEEEPADAMEEKEEADAEAAEEPAEEPQESDDPADDPLGEDEEDTEDDEDPFGDDGGDEVEEDPFEGM